MYGFVGRVKNWMIDSYFEGKINDVPEELREEVKNHCKNMKRANVIIPLKVEDIVEDKKEIK